LISISYAGKEQINNMTTTVIEAPLRKRYALVFDVETTGLIPKQARGSIHPIPITEYPYIIQFAFILYDIIDHRIVYMFDSLIKIPDMVPVPEKVVELTGINKLMCHMSGRNIIDCLVVFYEAYKMADCIVAHNLDFDQEMIMIEIERNRMDILTRVSPIMTLFQPMHERVRNLEKYCTMKQGTNLCSIVTESDSGRPPRLKWPKLGELYGCLFDGETVDGLHNAMVDVKACLRCYLKMRHSKNIPIL
jgi:DNA polymerase-3 subunit epsilon